MNYRAQQVFVIVFIAQGHRQDLKDIHIKQKQESIKGGMNETLII